MAGNRDDVEDLDESGREVWIDLLKQIDRFDLYGRAAYPKRHAAEDIPTIYRLAALSGGVFVNPALTEPFGLTLIEAAASGLPVVATADGGPRDILAHCDNGVLIDPLDSAAIAEGVREVLLDRSAWDQRARRGLAGVRRHFSWEAHAERYLELLHPIVAGAAPSLSHQRPSEPWVSFVDRALFSDLDQNLLGHAAALPALVALLRAHRKTLAFGIATGRRFDSAMRVIRAHGLPQPDILITSGGTEIRHGADMDRDVAWTRHIEKNWTPQIVQRVLGETPGLTLQPRSEQSRFKLSYYVDAARAPHLDEIRQMLLREDQDVNAILSFGQFLDILPARASKGLALRYVAAQFELPLERILAAGGSGADEDMMRGNTLAVVVGNRHQEELSQLADLDRIYFAKQPGAAGILEAIEHYDFLGRCAPPEEVPT